MSQGAGALAGLRVVEVASWTYVPAAAAVLAEWGADVIKIESPETGDPQRGLSSSGMVPVAPNGVEYLFELPNRGIDTHEAIFATRTLQDWQVALHELEGVWAPMQTAAELLDDPQVAAIGYLREIESATGARFRVVPSPVRFEEMSPDLVRAPLHGEHTDEVLVDLGLGMDQIIDLKITGAIL